VVELLKA